MTFDKKAKYSGFGDSGGFAAFFHSFDLFIVHTYDLNFIIREPYDYPMKAAAPTVLVTFYLTNYGFKKKLKLFL